MEFLLWRPFTDAKCIGNNMGFFLMHCMLHFAKFLANFHMHIIILVWNLTGNTCI